MPPEEFEASYIDAVVRTSMAVFGRSSFPDVDQERARKFHATYLGYFSYFAWRFPSWLMAIASNCPYQDVRRSIITDCVDEEVGDDEAGGRCHIDILYDEAEACGISRKEIVEMHPSATLRASIQGLENLARSYSWEIGFAAISSLEVISCEPAVKLRNELLSELYTPEQLEARKSARDIEFLVARTGLPKEKLQFGAHHQYKDQFHGGGELALLKKYAVRRDLQESMIWAARAGVETFALMRNECERLARAAIGLDAGAEGTSVTRG